jgi:hypothetical protein
VTSEHIPTGTKRQKTSNELLTKIRAECCRKLALDARRHGEAVALAQWILANIGSEVQQQERVALETRADFRSDRLWEIHKLATRSRVLPEDIDQIAQLSEGFAPIPPCSICQQRHAEPEQNCPTLQAKTAIGPQAPIANLIIDENGECSAACIYAPGLPAGSHDVYLDPSAPGLRTGTFTPTLTGHTGVKESAGEEP